MSTCTASPRAGSTLASAARPRCRGHRWDDFETNDLKALYFQGVERVETQALSTHGGQDDVFNLHLRPYHSNTHRGTLYTNTVNLHLRPYRGPRRAVQLSQGVRVHGGAKVPKPEVQLPRPRAKIWGTSLHNPRRLVCYMAMFYTKVYSYNTPISIYHLGWKQHIFRSQTPPTYPD